MEGEMAMVTAADRLVAEMGAVEAPDPVGARDREVQFPSALAIRREGTRPRQLMGPVGERP